MNKDYLTDLFINEAKSVLDKYPGSGAKLYRHDVEMNTGDGNCHIFSFYNGKPEPCTFADLYERPLLGYMNHDGVKQVDFYTIAPSAKDRVYVWGTAYDTEVEYYRDNIHDTVTEISASGVTKLYKHEINIDADGDTFICTVYSDKKEKCVAEDLYGLRTIGYLQRESGDERYVDLFTFYPPEDNPTRFSIYSEDADLDVFASTTNIDDTVTEIFSGGGAKLYSHYVKITKHNDPEDNFIISYYDSESEPCTVEDLSGLCTIGCRMYPEDTKTDFVVLEDISYSVNNGSWVLAIRAFNYDWDWEDENPVIRDTVTEIFSGGGGQSSGGESAKLYRHDITFHIEHYEGDNWQEKSITFSVLNRHKRSYTMNDISELYDALPAQFLANINYYGDAYFPSYAYGVVSADKFTDASNAPCLEFRGVCFNDDSELTVMNGHNIRLTDATGIEDTVTEV